MDTRLSLAQKKYLRSLGHDLKPVLIVGNAGVTPAVVREAMVGLAAHELLKVRLRVGERDARDAAIEALLEATGAVLVQRIGHIALIYRRHPERPSIILPSGS
ncbi:MAG: YhbY family RNA-binding protein [Gammaproteobacteria bacterium]|nr:YhbY family RNA-binding protein [Gammaproteobacteria bacterium]